MSAPKSDAHWADLLAACVEMVLVDEVSPAAAHFNALLQMAWEGSQ